MAQCRYCKVKVSRYAKSCPKCGCPYPAPKPKITPQPTTPDETFDEKVAVVYYFIAIIIFFVSDYGFVLSILQAILWPFFGWNDLLCVFTKFTLLGRVVTCEIQ